MLDEAEIQKISFHKSIHDMGMCTCPCLAAVFKISEAIKKERELMVKMALASPDLLAGLILGGEQVRAALEEEFSSYGTEGALSE